MLKKLVALDAFNPRILGADVGTSETEGEVEMLGWIERLGCDDLLG